MKKKLIIISGIILLSAVGYYFIINYNPISAKVIAKEEVPEEVIRESKMNNVSEEDILFTSKSEARFKYNISDNAVIKEKADFIILGKIDSIDGAINYNSTKNSYTFTKTIGELTVNKVIKGNLNEDKIPFIRAGGIINIEEYEKGLDDPLKAKLKLDNLSENDKKTKYIKEIFSDDINLEENKDYLMYLKYDPDYNKYAINFLQYGLREISIDTNVKQSYATQNDMYSNLENIKVKNNVTGQWEELNNII